MTAEPLRLAAVATGAPLLLGTGHVPLLLPASFRLDELIRSAHKTIDEAVKKYKLTELWAAFSGGHDSLVMTHLVSQHPLFRGVLHIDTGIGVPECRQFVERICRFYDWKLIVKMPATTYPMLTIRYAFPGPPMHQEMYKYLKERPLRQAVIEAKAGRKKTVIGKCGGMRSQESARREQNTEPYNKGKEGIWISPIHNWTAFDCLDYLRAFDIPRSPVKDKIHKSGDCLCGSFAKEGELEELDLWYPETARKIRNIQAIVKLSKELGITDQPARRCEWGHGAGVPQAQLKLPMCWNCSIASTEAL